MQRPISAEQLIKDLPDHGGNVAAAAHYFNIDCDHWIDLSTGINPMPYPIPELPTACFTDLPYLSSELMVAAEAYYGAKPAAVVAGTQVVIQQLPTLINQYTVRTYGHQFPVILPSVGYSEHRRAWLAAANTVFDYSAAGVGQGANLGVIESDIDRAIINNQQQHLVLIQPNNPSGLLFSTVQIRRWADSLASGGFVIVDEAFIDPIAGQSVLAAADDLPSNIIVLRSFGKFFGLAGLRLGFVFHGQDCPLQLPQQLAVWSINGPAQAIACRALLDSPWQAQARITIQQQAQQRDIIFAPLLQAYTRVATTDLFVTIQLPLAVALNLYIHFAKAGILLRVFKQDNGLAWIRIGNLALDHTAETTRVTQCLNAWQPA